MIFKCSLWNKANNTWKSSNAYCSVCISPRHEVTDILVSVFNRLSEQKLISVPLERLALADRSIPGTKTYHLMHVVNGKRVNLVRLLQMPHKANNFGKSDVKSSIASLWLDEVPRYTQVRMPEFEIRLTLPRIDNNEQAQPVAEVIPEPTAMRGRNVDQIIIDDLDWQDPPF